MSDAQTVIELVRGAFGGNSYPGDGYLQGSVEGDEPGEEIGPFVGQVDWQTVSAEMLDAHAGALSFFSEAGLRFFLPAFLIADLKGELQVADPQMTLTHGFSDVEVKLPVGEQVFRITSGKSALINPRRYGAATFFDYARYRFSVFTREEAGAIAAYLQHKQDSGETFDLAPIEAALNHFWLERAQMAPTRDDLRQNLEDQAAYLKAIQEQSGPEK
jgi:hypothetical protein